MCSYAWSAEKLEFVCGSRLTGSISWAAISVPPRFGWVAAAAGAGTTSPPGPPNARPPASPPPSASPPVTKPRRLNRPCRRFGPRISSTMSPSPAPPVPRGRAFAVTRLGFHGPGRPSSPPIAARKRWRGGGGLQHRALHLHEPFQQRGILESGNARDFAPRQCRERRGHHIGRRHPRPRAQVHRSEEHTSELQSRENLVCRLL